MTRSLVLLFALTMACKARPPVTPVVETVAPANKTVEIVQSPLDQRGYRYVELANGMRGVVIHDDDVDLAAASLSVDVGHFVDPQQRQGLAHFLEHMLFMGTDKYPDVDDYRKFIQDNGGGTNAGTGTESTTYFFQVKHEVLSPALDRFSRFFIAPRLDAAFVERERNAVNSEYSLKIKEDVRRIREVQKKTRNPAHPYSKFSVGNLDTLGDRDGEDLHADLRALYAAHYVADNMTFAIIGRESLDQLEFMARSSFAEVPTRTLEEDLNRPEAYLPEQLGVEIRIVPEKAQKVLDLIFPGMPSSQSNLPERPLDLLTSLIGDEGEGSLFQALKGKGWIRSLSTGEDGTRDYSEMTVHIELTDEGYANRDKVVTTFFQFVDTLRGADLEPHFQELAKIGALNFAYAEETPSVGAVQGIVRSLPFVPPEHLLDFGYRYERFDAEMVREHLALIRPDNLRLLVIAPDVQTDKVEPLYQTPYAIEPLSDARKKAFVAGGIEAELALRPLNPYVADDARLRTGADDPKPVQVAKDEALEIWHMQDTSFKVPRAYVQVVLETPGDTNAADQVQFGLLQRLLDDDFEAFRYPLRQAGLSVRIDAMEMGIQLSLTGYDQKQPEVLEEVVRRLQAFRVDPARFAIEKAELIEDFENQAKDRPIGQTYDAMSRLLNPDRFSMEAQLAVLRKTTPAEVEKRLERVKNQSTGRLFVHGNVDRAGTEALAKTLEPLVKRKGELRASRMHVPAAKTVRVDKPIDHADSTIAMSFRGEPGEDVAKTARFSLLGALLRTDFFTELRTNQQLGYVVYASADADALIPAINFGIQSSVANPDVLEARIAAFVAERPGVIEGMDAAAFQTVKDGLIAQIMEKESRLYDRTGRLLGELAMHELDFDSREKLSAAVGTLTQADMVTFAKALMIEGTPRTMIVRSQGSAHDPMKKGDCTYPDCKSFSKLPIVERAR